MNRLLRRALLVAFQMDRDIDHHDGVLLHDADEQDDADQRDHRERHAEQQQGQGGADPGRRQRRQDGQGVNGVFVENAQDNVDGDEGREDQQRYRRQRLGKNLGRTLEAAMDRGGRAQLAHRRLDRRLRRAERSARRQVEGKRRRDQAALVVDLDRRVVVDGLGQGGQRHHGFGGRAVGAAARRSAPAVRYRVGCQVRLRIGVERVGVGRRHPGGNGGERLHARYRAGRHLRLLCAGHIAGSGAEENPVEVLRLLPIFRRHLHHHEILIVRIVDGRNRALAERIVEHGVDLVWREAVARRRGPVDRHIGLQAVLLHVRIDVGQLIRMLAKLGDQLGNQAVDGAGVVAAQRILVFRRRLPAADMQILLRLQEQPRAGNSVEPGTQALDDLFGRSAPLGERLQGDEDGGGVARAAGRAGAGEAEDRGDRGVLLHDALQLGELLGHRREGDRLVGDDLSDHDAGILLGEEGRRQHPEQEDIAHDQADQQEADQQRVVEHGMQPAGIGIPEAVELALRPDCPACPGGRFRAVLEHPRAHAGRYGERDHHRDQDGDRQRHRELVEHQADGARHQQDRDEHRNQRQAHRDDREAHLGAAAQGRFARRQSLVEMAHDVLEHDHGVVDDEARADGERHQRQIVDAVAHQVHRPERADDRQRQRHRRYPDRLRRLQEDEDHADHQHHGDRERALGVADRGGDRLRAVHGDVDAHAVRQGRLDRRQDPADLGIGRDDVGARYGIDDDAHCRRAVVEADIADVLVGILHVGDVMQQDG